MRLRPDRFRALYDEVTLMIKETATEYGVDPRKIRTRRKTRSVALVRKIIARNLRWHILESDKADWCFAYEKMTQGTWVPLSTVNIGLLLNLEHSTITGYLKGEYNDQQESK